MFENIGKVLRELRLRRRMQQQEVAAEAGVVKGALSRWESGKVTPSLQNLDLLLDTLGVEPYEFIRTCEDVERLQQVERQVDAYTADLDLRGIGISLLLEEQIGRLVEMKQRKIDEEGESADTAFLTENIERLKKVAEAAAQGTILQALAKIGAEQVKKQEQKGSSSPEAPTA